MNGVVIGVAVIFSAGVFLGHATASPEVDIVRVTKTKTVYVKPEPVVPPTVTRTPQACLDALLYADRLYTSANNIYGRGREQVDLISLARRTLAEQGDISAVENKQRDLSGAIVGDLDALAEAKYNYDTNIKECEAAQ